MATEAEAVSELRRQHMSGCDVELLALHRPGQPSVLLRNSTDSRYDRSYWPVLRGFPVSCTHKPRRIVCDGLRATATPERGASTAQANIKQPTTPARRRTPL